MNNILSIIIYVPKWESFQQEWFDTLDFLCRKYQVIVVFDGSQNAPLAKDITSILKEKSEGFISILLELLPQIKTERTLLLRQGFSISEENLERLLSQKEDSVAISYSDNKDLSDHCLLFSTTDCISIWKKVNRLLFSGYSLHFQALLKKFGLKYKTLSSEGLVSKDITIASLYIQQQISNILHWVLRDLASEIQLPASWLPPQTEKISIVVLVWNNLKVTIPCLLSIMRFTKQPFELIIVDNGSHEPVDKWIKKNLSKYDNVVYHRNEVNQGFPQGCNDGMALATGEHILLLNNDTVVTPFWLTRQVAAFVDPKVGLVGPLSINTSRNQNILNFLPEQYTEAPWKNIKQMLPWTNRFCRQNFGNHKNNSIAVLIGLCFLIRKEVWQTVGGMDSIYGFGNCEDADYCFRTSRLGYTQFQAQDIFVDHIGSATFSASKLPYQNLSWENIIYSHFKNLSAENATKAIELATSYERAKISREYWRELRDWDIELDHIPFLIKDYLNWDSTTRSSKQKLLVFPSVFHAKWLPTIQEAIAQGWELILRIEPPAPHFTTFIESQIQTLSVQEQNQISISQDYMATTQRMFLYKKASAVLHTERFDWFRFEREATILGLSILRTKIPSINSEKQL